MGQQTGGQVLLYVFLAVQAPTSFMPSAVRLLADSDPHDPANRPPCMCFAQRGKAPTETESCFPALHVSCCRTPLRERTLTQIWTVRLVSSLARSRKDESRLSQMLFGRTKLTPIENANDRLLCSNLRRNRWQPDVYFAPTLDLRLALDQVSVCFSGFRSFVHHS